MLSCRRSPCTCRRHRRWCRCCTSIPFRRKKRGRCSWCRPRAGGGGAAAQYAESCCCAVMHEEQVAHGNWWPSLVWYAIRVHVPGRHRSSCTLGGRPGRAAGRRSGAGAGPRGAIGRRQGKRIESRRVQGLPGVGNVKQRFSATAAEQAQGEREHRHHDGQSSKGPDFIGRGYGGRVRNLPTARCEVERPPIGASHPLRNAQRGLMASPCARRRARPFCAPSLGFAGRVNASTRPGRPVVAPACHSCGIKTARHGVTLASFSVQGATSPRQ